MTDIFSREETELAVYGWIRRSFQNLYIPPDISKLITIFWDDTNYWLLKGYEFESYLSTKTKSFTHTQQVDAALQLASFTLTLDKAAKTKWTLRMTDNKTQKNGYFAMCLVYFEIFCEEINYYYKNTVIFDIHNNYTKTWSDTLFLSRVNKLSKYKHNRDKEKKVRFGCFIQVLSKKYRIGWMKYHIARFDDYHKKIMMKKNIKYEWRNCVNSKKHKCIFSASFDHGNWCLKRLKYVDSSSVFIKLLRVHGLIEKLIIECKFYMKTKDFGLSNVVTREITIKCDSLQWIRLTKYALNMISCGVDIKILKVFKIAEYAISEISPRYWYVYGIQNKKQSKKNGKKMEMEIVDPNKNKRKKVHFKVEEMKNNNMIFESERKEKQTDELSNKNARNWRFKKRKKIKYTDKKAKKNQK